MGRDPKKHTIPIGAVFCNSHALSMVWKSTEILARTSEAGWSTRAVAMAVGLMTLASRANVPAVFAGSAPWWGVPRKAMPWIE
jgi:hypothetical protein